MAVSASTTLSPTQSVQQYQSSLLPGEGRPQPLPRTYLQSTVPKIPYPAKTGSGTYTPTAQASSIFGAVKSNFDPAPYIKQRQERQASGGVTAPSGPALKGGVGTGAYGLTAQAGSRLQALQKAYRAAGFGTLGVNSGGRSYADQVKAYQNYLRGGNLAAKPGTSVHETGRAADLAVMNSNSPQHRWLQANAPKFGWVWAGKNFSQVEPWHWEFRG